MRVMVVGGGAREHALVARLAGDPGVTELLCAPGNPGIASLARVASVETVDVDGLVQLAQRERIDLTVVGPEVPLSQGLADRFHDADRLLVGPTRGAARLESSKVFAKAFMTRHGVPTARHRTVDQVDEAVRILDAGVLGWPVVLKADGLAAGKGVVIASGPDEARGAVVAALRDRRFGAAGTTLVIEECLTGPEVSFFVLADGARARVIGTAQDHKRIHDDDRGPNTGGMGAFAPSPLVGEDLCAQITRRIVDPVLRGMESEGYPFRGFLYVGLMLTSAGPRVIEFNVRLGDPEAQVILSLIAEPLLPLLIDAASGSLRAGSCPVVAETRVGVVLASRGYPESSESGRPISGIERAEAMPGVSVFHAGTARRDGRLVTAGGRVLTVVGAGHDYGTAIERAYGGVRQIAFDGMQFRRDIGQKALRSPV